MMGRGKRRIPRNSSVIILVVDNDSPETQIKRTLLTNILGGSTETNWIGRIC